MFSFTVCNDMAFLSGFPCWRIRVWCIWGGTGLGQPPAWWSRTPGEGGRGRLWPAVSSFRKNRPHSSLPWACLPCLFSPLDVKG